MMAVDQKSPVPVRTETPGAVAAKIVDGTTPAQQLSVDSTGKIAAKASDGAGNALTSTLESGRRAMDVSLVPSSKSVQLFDQPYDSIAVTYPNATTEVYTTYLGGLSGAQVQVVTVSYVDASKNELLSVVRT